MLFVNFDSFTTCCRNEQNCGFSCAGQWMGKLEGLRIYLSFFLQFKGRSWKVLVSSTLLTTPGLHSMRGEACWDIVLVLVELVEKQ